MPTCLPTQVKAQLPQGMCQDSLGNLYTLKDAAVGPCFPKDPTDHGGPKEQSLLGKGRREDTTGGSKVLRVPAGHNQFLGFPRPVTSVSKYQLLL